ncbi:MAG TPA: hypothetical protein VGL61_30875 [Kofleriaceae bacterium]|jgi:hypothetical protein
MRWLVPVLACAACGDNIAETALDAPPAKDAPAPACTAIFGGNLVDSASGSANCPSLDGAGIVFSLAEPQLAVPVAIAIDVGPSPAAGDYSSETVPDWSVYSYELDMNGGGGTCLYSAGGSATPTGSFTMTLTAADATAVHGTLSIIAWVLVFPGTSCGTVDNETIALSF